MQPRAICLYLVLTTTTSVNCSVFGLNKVEILKNKFGFDGAFNYKEEQEYDVIV